MLDKRLQNIRGDRPWMIAYKAPTRGDALIRSKFRKSTHGPLNVHPALKGMFACGKCSICKYVENIREFKDSQGRRMYQKNYFLNCSSTWVVYRIVCACQKNYIGKTCRELIKRIGEHLMENLTF